MENEVTTVREVRIPSGNVVLEGDLAIPPEAKGIVVFAHGSGSSRKSVRNRYVAEIIQKAGIATLLFDLLTRDEEIAEMYTRHLRFDIGLLAGRLLDAVDWLKTLAETKDLRIGLFGASTGGAAALVAAARATDAIGAVVSRGGRPDLAGDSLAKVRAPVLLIVGGNDGIVIGLNESAASQLNCEPELKIVPGATHLFEEPGTLEEVARLAAEFFREKIG
ncbi:MAG: dienelactone hydrolase family protein [Acidobacteria bacterium]|nr:dienelactone hydrolase family protein [Acidobacteriota bacterium]